MSLSHPLLASLHTRQDSDINDLKELLPDRSSTAKPVPSAALVSSDIPDDIEDSAAVNSKKAEELKVRQSQKAVRKVRSKAEILALRKERYRIRKNAMVSKRNKNKINALAQEYGITQSSAQDPSVSDKLRRAATRYNNGREGSKEERTQVILDAIDSAYALEGGQYSIETVVQEYNDLTGLKLITDMSKIKTETAATASAMAASEVSPATISGDVSSAQVAQLQAVVNDALSRQGTSRPEMAKLMTALNINLSIQLSKTDTANLLACLLTCNSTQLNALMHNNKVPIAIKTVIRRLLEDEREGNTGTIERLWDRIFGKGPLQLDLPEQAQGQTGIIPNTPVSREAYILIRDTLIK